MPVQPPFAPKPGFDTQLDPLQELAFRHWVTQNRVPFDPNAGATDYDMRGYWRGLQQGNPMAVPSQIDPNDNRPHYTDYYKTPLHETFSSESQWSNANTPTWIDQNRLAAPNGKVIFNGRKNEIANALLSFPSPSEEDRANGIRELTRRMGGNVPWYSEKAASQHAAEMEKIRQAIDSFNISNAVPRRGW